MPAQKTKSERVAKVTKAIAQARGTDDVSLAGSPRGGADLMPAELDDHARDGIRLSFLIHDVSRMRRSAYDHYMKPLGITRAQWWVLAHLSRHDGMMQTQLADVLEVGKASLGDVIESLESGGWVSRRPDPTDKRAKRVYLSKSAQGLIKRMTQLEVEFNERVLADLSPDEQTTLFKLLLKVKQSISRIAAA
ncbi:MAG: MarR family winged helix-turn-helix transcriptional regulator [Nevskia sp.]|uniref:MarR family winged helix-turn-helix transcriptional regulator n=1 Tax=Nevskia sp. TaxID=1929292 RepID=UPI0040361B4C